MDATVSDTRTTVLPWRLLLAEKTAVGMTDHRRAGTTRVPGLGAGWWAGGVAVTLLLASVSCSGEGAESEAGGEGSGDQVFTAPGPAQGADIFLAELIPSGAGFITGPIRNVTNRPGYDNQPQWLLDGSGFFYTVVDEAGQADIWQYDLAGNRATPMTSTAPESEYSGTPIPGEDAFSAVRVEADSTQRLWRFPRDGSPPTVILPDVAPVGYHAWFGEELLLLHVLGPPATLRLADVGRGEARVLAEDIGRSIQNIPGEEGISFVQRDDEGGTTIMRWDPSGALSTITEALGDGDFHAWTADGGLLMGMASGVFLWNAEADGWSKVADLADLGVTSVTRLAVSPDGERMAIVGESG